MPLSLHDAKATADLAKLFYDFLPGSGHGSLAGHVTFQKVATQLDLGEFWSGGSKQPALARLFEQTLNHKRSKFEHLVLAIVSEGIKYRRGKNKEVRESEILAVNRVIKNHGFKFPDLWDPAFLASLESDPNTAIDNPAMAVSYEPTSPSLIQSQLPALREEFYKLAAASDRRMAGIALKKLLYRLFQLFDLNPGKDFRITGEQIDGSFILDHETYLLEAKWQAKPTNEAALLTFRGKIEGKSAQYTRSLPCNQQLYS